MMHKPLLGLLVVLAISGCATAPTGPQVMAMPGSSKSSEQFRYDDRECRHYAHDSIDPNAANNTGVRDAAIGTLIGAALGGHEGAAVGAGTGLIAGSMVGAGESQAVGYSTQRQYDQTYLQCMYGKGHKVPMASAPAQQRAPAPPPPNYPPPPPPGWRGY